MTTQNYLLINEQTNICENVVLWDGNTTDWRPPAGFLALVQPTTPAKIWGWNLDSNVWQLDVVVGAGGIGFLWDGQYVVTPDPEPPMPDLSPIEQPISQGTQTL